MKSTAIQENNRNFRQFHPQNMFRPCPRGLQHKFHRVVTLMTNNRAYIFNFESKTLLTSLHTSFLSFDGNAAALGSTRLWTWWKVFIETPQVWNTSSNVFLHYVFACT